MPNVRVNINGPEQENTTAVTIGNMRWGVNGKDFGSHQVIEMGIKELKVYKTSNPKELGVHIDIVEDVILNITVNEDSFNIVPAF